MKTLGVRLFKALALSLLVGWLTTSGLAQPALPPDPYFQLTTWSFNDTTWYSDPGYPPISFTNLNNPPGFDGNALQVDSTNAAWLQYNIIEPGGPTNLTFVQGAIEFWVLPDWNSGTGLGDYGRLIDVGAYSTNNPSSWWSLYFTPDGNNLCFSSETNGVFTNYLAAPISWDTNTWHFVALAYNRFQSHLYIDGQLATNGTGTLYEPDTNTLANGFFVGSDVTGTQQSRAQIDDLVTYNYLRSAGEIADDYTNGLEIMGGGSYADLSPPAFPGGSSTNGSGTNTLSNIDTYVPDYGSNLWVATLGISDSVAGLMLSNSSPDILYEVQGINDLTLAPSGWFSEGFVYGSELTNFTFASAFASQQTNLFLRIRSWQDSSGTGIPDWWWLTYFGQTTNVDAYATDPAGDGYTYLQKFQMGLNPTNYYGTNVLTGFFGCLDATGTNVLLEWSPLPGPVTYLVQRGILNTNTGIYTYTQIAEVNSNAAFFEDAGAINNSNAWNNIYNVEVAYPAAVLPVTNTWNASLYALYAMFSFPPYTAPQPNSVYAYWDDTGSNVLLSWTSASSQATNYIIVQGVWNNTSENYDYYPLATVSSNSFSYEVVDAVDYDDDGSDVYGVEAVYPGGGMSSAAISTINSSPPSPPGFSATVDSTGTNVVLTWTPLPGATNYVIQRGVLNTNTGSYSYTQIGEVAPGTTSFEDSGAITGNNSYNNIYLNMALFSDGTESPVGDAYLPGSPPPPPVVYSNIYLTAYLVRNGTGRWQVMFSGYPTNTPQTIKLLWTASNGDTTPQTISTGTLTNGIYPVPDSDSPGFMGDSLSAQLYDVNGNPGQIAQAGVLENDAPYFVDGRQHLKQNLNFMIRAASQTSTFSSHTSVLTRYFYTIEGSTSTNFEESSFISASTFDNLLPFEQNQLLKDCLASTTTTNWPYGNKDFNFQVDFTTNIPAQPLLAQSDPYWTMQAIPESGLAAQDGGAFGLSEWGLNDNGAYPITVGLQNGGENLFGLPFETGQMVYLTTVGTYTNLSITPGTTVSVPDTNTDYFVTYGNECPAPVLQFTNYYFAPLTNPGVLISSFPQTVPQSFPLPFDGTFSTTNQTPPLIVGSIGQPMILGSWAKYYIQGSASKYAYLGQYFETNSFLLDTNGSATTTNAGVLSPYGEFFPLQAGIAQMVTMPDIDSPYEQGTNFVRIVSLNVDANHDGTMDFTYAGSDFVSASKPFRFWVNDNQDSGDFGGNFGIPGLTPPLADGWNYVNTAGYHVYMGLNTAASPVYNVHGRRDLVDFFPLYLNISSLFQSNALSAGISVTDTNYQFVLSQADGLLRFVYTDLTPTNYMNYLQDTNESGLLADALAITIPSTGIALTNSFLSGIATNNEDIILVEAASATTQPLVLTIYHGTNQIAQTSLSLSISGVEQMFRSKTMLLHSTEGMVPDRLTDADVPNEPDTISKNFVFVHGYNVLPQEARGVAADVFKRMYWSGSHAKFWAVTWNGADTKGSPPFYNALTPNYHTNVVDAFATAPLLADFIATLTNSGPVVVAAHSLGNMVTLSAISDWNAPISQYFMLDAAVPIEAIDPTSTNVSFMTFSTWQNYSNRVFASDWYQLFATNDYRSTLFWNNRLSNLGNVDVYNFYSSGEEVLRTYSGDPPSTVLNMVDTQILNNLWDGVPFGTGTWYWQEKGKGTCTQDWFLGSSHGGWRFPVDQYGDSDPVPPATANSLANSVLQTNSIFSFGSYFDQVDGPFPDLALLGSGGSTYAQANRNRILADAIPAMSLVAGANPVPAFSPPKSAVERNFDMNTPQFQNGWALGRLLGGEENNNWYHSDFHQMAYTFTYKLYTQFVTTGNLK